MSKIEWTGKTPNPVAGCSKKSEGCKECYAIKMAWRLMHSPRPAVAAKYAGTVYKTLGGQLNWTGKVNFDITQMLQMVKSKKPTMFFVNSMGDLFHPNVTFLQIDTVFRIMNDNAHHIYQVLTKHPERAVEFYTWKFQEHNILWQAHPNVWIGTSDEGNQHARIDFLRQIPAAVRFISAEPLIFNPGQINLEGVHWVIAGGESGHQARAVHPDWVRSLRDQCAATGVAFFFKQWGQWKQVPDFTAPECKGAKTVQINGQYFARVGKKKSGRELDGRTWDQFPNQINVDHASI